MGQGVGDGQQQAVGGRERGRQTARGDQTSDHIRQARDLRRGEHDDVRIDHEVLQPHDAGMAGNRLTRGHDRIDVGSVLAADLDQAEFAPGENPGFEIADVRPDDVGVHLQLRERRIGRRREVQQEDEQQRPSHRLTGFTHRRGGEVTHQNVRQRSRAHHHAEADREEVERTVVDERRNVRFERRRRRQAARQHLLLAGGDFRDRLAVGQLRDRDPIVLGGQDHDRGQVGDDQHDVLGDLRPGHRLHAAQHRAEQDAGEAREHREFERHAEEARGDDAGAVDLRGHIGERAAHQHDDAEEAGEVAAVPERQEVRHGVGAELAQIRADQDRHQHEAAGPAEHPGQPVIAEQEQGAGHADEGGRRHPVGAGRHAVVERGHDPARHVVFRNLGGSAHHADDGVDRDREADEQIAEHLVRHADLLENGEQNNEGDEAAGVGAVHPSEIFDEIGLDGCLRCHCLIPLSRLRRSRGRGRSCLAALRT